MLVFESKMPHELPISHASRQQQRDDQMWVKEGKKARLYGLLKIWCPY